MRSDAAQRRAMIVREARRMFAAHGNTVALESIAEASGVGIATFYRNFESRSALADEVALAILTDMQRAADEALATIDSTPKATWGHYIDRLVELDLGALTAELAEFVADEMSGPVKEAQARTLAGVEQILGAAQAAGLVRPDFTALELVLAVGMITRPQPEAIRLAAPLLVAHLRSILVSGMRPEA